MSMNYAYTPHIWPSIMMVVLMVTLSIYSGRRRSVPGAAPLMVASLLAAAWAVGALFETASLNLETRVFWFKVQAVIQLPIITAITCFILEYTWPGRWLTRRNLALLSLPILLFIGMILTNDLYHLAWRSFPVMGTLRPEQGPGSWLMAIYFMVVLEALNLVVFGWLFLHSPQHRWPVALMLIGQIVGRTLFLVDRLYPLNSILPLDLLGMSFEFLMYAIALFGFRILDPIPLARQTLIQQLQAGMLVLDPQGTVVSSNPAASAFLELPAKRLLGSSIQRLLPAVTDLAGDLQAARTGEVEVSLGSEPGARDLRVEVSPLKDWRGLDVGRLLLLHDVTEQKRAQAQILEQQRALAMLHEREQLARELHDSLGQAFAFINAQGQTIRRLLSRGDLATADEYTGRLVEVAREADVDIRESILGLRVALSGQGFFPVLAQFLDQYEKNYGIHTELVNQDALLDCAFEPPVEAQLLRILQEALTNVRKHACAHSISMTFAIRDGCARITILDDGQGFNPDELADPFSEHVGLRVMLERALEIGGNLEVHSTPGAGTQVIVRAPVSKKLGTMNGSCT